MPRKGEKAPGTGWANPAHPMHQPVRPPAPYETGNVAALVHGATSSRVIAPVAAQLVAEAVEGAPYLSEPKYGASLEAWGRAEARVRLLEAFLADEGLLTADGDVRAAAAFQLSCEKQAGRLRAELGLTPESAARLGRDVAGAKFDLARYWAEISKQEDGE